VNRGNVNGIKKDCCFEATVQSTTDRKKKLNEINYLRTITINCIPVTTQYITTLIVTSWRLPTGGLQYVANLKFLVITNHHPRMTATAIIITLDNMDILTANLIGVTAGHMSKLGTSRICIPLGLQVLTILLDTQV
jgi:hypothetical protein